MIQTLKILITIFLFILTLLSVFAVVCFKAPMLIFVMFGFGILATKTLCEWC